MISLGEHITELLARKASIDATLQGITQLLLFKAQKESELRWVKMSLDDAEALGIDISSADREKYAHLQEALEEELLALQARKENTEILSEALQEAFTVRLAHLFHIDITAEKWEIDFDQQCLRRIGEDACCTEELKT